MLGGGESPKALSQDWAAVCGMWLLWSYWGRAGPQHLLWQDKVSGRYSSVRCLVIKLILS